MRSLRNSIGSSSEVHKSLQGYESLKSNLLEFPSMEISKTRNNSIDPGLKSLRIKLTEMETILKISRERVRLLERTVEDLSTQVEKLQGVNKALLSEKLDLNSSDIHYFVQDLIVNDIKKQLEETQEDMEKYRLDSERYKKKYETIVQENKRIEGMIKRYRKIVSEFGASKIIPLENSSAVDDGEALLPNIKKHWTDKIKPKNPEKPRVKYWNIIEQGLKEMTESSSLVHLFTKTCTTLRSLTSSSKISLYIISPSIQNIYVQHFQSVQHVQRVLLGNTWVQLHTDPSCDVVEPSFSKTDEVTPSLRSPEKLIFCLSLQKEPSLVLQLLSPPRAFDANDEKMVSIVMQFLACCTKLIMSGKREKSLKDQLVEIVNVSSAISKSRSHQSLANSVDELLPKFFECETAGVVFVDEESQELYTLAYSSEQNKKYSQDIIRFPITMGLTGETYKNKGCMIYEGVKKKHLYNPEIDNIASASDLNSCLMSCLPGPNSSIVGVLQLGNKSGGFSQREIQVVTGVSTILGFMVAGINDISEAMELTIKMKQHLYNLSVGLGGDIHELSPDTSGIVDQIEIIKSVVYTWSKSKKAKMQTIL
jgi:hypothetical protein